jgi:hypothetical protein
MFGEIEHVAEIYREIADLQTGLGLLHHRHPSHFFGMIVFTRYRMTGHLNLKAMVDHGSETKPFRERNPHLDLVDSYPHTGLVIVRDRRTGGTAMLDLAVGLSAQVRPVSCEDSGGFRPEIIYPGAGETICFAIDKPDTGAGVMFTYAASFSARAKDSQVEQFYRNLFASRGRRVTVVQNSSRAIILEAENESHDTVARISIRGSFDTARGFLAWTKDFR